MSVSASGYLRIGSTDVDAWMDFGTGVLGMMDAQREDTGGARFLRLDDHPFRFMVEPAEADGLIATGLEFPDEDAFIRTCEALVAHGAQHLVLIDSISPRRAPTAGRALEAKQMDAAEWAAYVTRFREICKMGVDYGRTVGVHAHAAGFMDFEPELERLLGEIPEDLLQICFDTGHHSYAGFDPIAFMEKWINRISYMHFKDIDPKVKAEVIAKRTGFYEACGQGIFCNLGDGDVDFPAARQLLLDHGFEGWCTVEQDCDPTLDVKPVDDAHLNRTYLQSIGF